MVQRPITVPELGLVAGTRALLGAGVALLVADKLAPQSRRAVGWTLVGVGIVSTFPLLAQFLSRPPAGTNHKKPAEKPVAKH
jgi:hypothetical protein